MNKKPTFTMQIQRTKYNEPKANFITMNQNTYNEPNTNIIRINQNINNAYKTK